MRPLFSSTIFVAAFLLLAVEPLVGKSVLPLFGGSHAVWSVCLVFFQGSLLLGYLYAHLGVRVLGLRRHALLHTILLVASLLLLPLSLPAPIGSDYPSLSLLLMLTLGLGAPFILLSATSPLLQRWYADTPGARDPFALYAASNLGSALAVLAYPLIIEPSAGLVRQRYGWSVGYALLVATIALCCFTSVRSEVKREVAGNDGSPPLVRKVYWMALSGITGSLLLGVTSYLSANVAPIPLLWMPPLLLYLLSFVAAFRSGTRRHEEILGRVYKILTVGALLTASLQLGEPLELIVPLHLGTFYLGTYLCHSALSSSRPAESLLTEYYLWISVGGAVGGLLTAFAAPALFSTPLEYPLALAVTAGLLFAPVPTRRVALHATLLFCLLGGIGVVWRSMVLWLVPEPGPQWFVPMSGVLAVIAYLFRQTPLLFVMGLIATLVYGGRYDGQFGTATSWDRNFYGIVRTTISPDKLFRYMVHGTTLHGSERIDTTECAPLTYYHPTGPAGDIFRHRTPGDVAIIGLGAGSLTCYSQPDERWDLFEINPLVVRRATEEFSFLRRSPSQRQRIFTGDGRARLSAVDDTHYSLVVVDAFSSDAIPFHLLSHEAFELYRRVMSPHSIIALHISNKFLDLEGAIARTVAAVGLSALVREDLDLPEDLAQQGKLASVWMAVGDESTLSQLRTVRGWRTAIRSPGAPWTDDYANLIEVLR